jgi:chitinase
MSYRTIGYFENWAQYRQAGGKFFPNQIDASLFTHINFAFGLFGFVTWSVDPTPTRTGPQRLTGDYTVQPTEWNDETVLYPALNALKQQNPNLKTLLSIGGWSMNSATDVPTSGNPHPYGPYTYQLFSRMVADPKGRAQFINSAITFARNYGFDGIDLDWEYPGDSTRGGTPDDLNHFLTLLQEFRAAAGPNFLLSMASPAIVPSNLPPQWVNDPQSFFSWLAACAQSLDWLNMETYDYHGSFDPATVGTGVNSPLLEDSTPNGPFSIKNSVESYLAAGISGAKINLGLPTYGRSYTVANPSLLVPHPAPGLPFSGPGPAGPATAEAGTLAYYEIVQQLLAKSLTSGWDPGTLTPYAYNAQTGVWVSYDNEQSIGYKISYLLEKGLGGAMFWAIDDDAFPAMADTRHKTSRQIPNAVRKDAANGFPLMNTAKAILDNPSTAPPLPTPGPVTTQNWMRALPGHLKLSRLTIPGTHESCARGIGWPAGVFVNCQDLSLADQLNAGIRYLDIRCRHISDIFAIHHEAFYLGLNFGNGVRDVCVNFLQANPSECILMEIKREYNDAGNNLTFQQVFDNYVKGYENFFYLSDHIPTLDEARGKIVVICRFTVDTDADVHTHGLYGNPWADNTTFTRTYTASNNETVNITIQDNYNWTNVFNDNIDAKYSDIWNTLLQAQADGTDRLFINFTSASSTDGAASPQNFVYAINPRLYNDLAKFGPSWPNRLGVLAMDFVNDGGPPNPFPPADAVIQRVISFNDKLKTSSIATDSQLIEAVGP